MKNKKPVFTVIYYLLKDNENIAKQTLQQEMATGINGLAHECNDVCSEINIPEITNINVLSKRQIKSKKAITERNRNDMLSFKSGRQSI